MNLNWAKIIGWGLLIWVIMFALVFLFVTYDLRGSTWTSAILLLAAFGISYTLAAVVEPKSTVEAFTYGVGWVAVSLFLDAVITMRFQITIFSSFTLWAGYVVILLAPWVEFVMGRQEGGFILKPRT